MREPTIELYTAMSSAHWDSDLHIWPESAVPLFYYQAQPVLAALGEAAREHQTEILLGLIYQTPDSPDYYNSMIGVGSNNGVYHKRHLVPFTEFLPLKSVLAGLVDFMAVPMSDFSSGARGQSLLQVHGQKIGMSICYEDAFGEEVIESLPGANLLVNVSNDAWFSGSIAPAQHLQIARMRALETARPLLRATNTGLTAMVDFHGRLVDIAPQDEAYVLTTTVQPRAGMPPYAAIGNGPVVLISTLLGAGVWLLRLFQRGNGDA
jgi:apolipoprotein N-acyltransferase